MGDPEAYVIRSPGRSQKKNILTKTKNAKKKRKKDTDSSLLGLQAGCQERSKFRHPNVHVK